jgi:heterodisulfide reductase subunit B
MNVEAYQDKINEVYKTDYKIPVLFFTQVLGLALGFSEHELEIDRLLADGVKLNGTLVNS